MRRLIIASRSRASLPDASLKYPQPYRLPSHAEFVSGSRSGGGVDCLKASRLTPTYEPLLIEQDIRETVHQMFSVSVLHFWKSEVPEWPRELVIVSHSRQPGPSFHLAPDRDRFSSEM